MKNKVKMLGIIAVIAIIGLAVGCGPADPEDQIQIEITDFPSGANNYYAYILIGDTTAGTTSAQADSSSKIEGGKVNCLMIDEKGAFGKKGNYNIAIYIDKDSTTVMQASSGQAEFFFYTPSKVAVEKGANSFPASSLKSLDGKVVSDFFSNNPDKPAASNYGIYTTKYTSSSKTVTETVDLGETKFNISDDENGTTNPDHLDFKITDWKEIATADLPKDATDAGYIGGYKFTGKMISQKGYTTGSTTSQTAPGFTAADVKEDGTGPECWMYIYFKGTAPNITFIRTPFSKSGNLNEGIVSGTGGPRVYTK